MSATVYFENGRPIRGFSGLGASSAFDAANEASTPSGRAVAKMSGLLIGIGILELGLIGGCIYNVVKGNTKTAVGFGIGALATPSIVGTLGLGIIGSTEENLRSSGMNS